MLSIHCITKQVIWFRYIEMFYINVKRCWLKFTNFSQVLEQRHIQFGECVLLLRAKLLHFLSFTQKLKKAHTSFMTMGWDYVSELRPSAGIIFVSPRWYMSMGSNGGMMLTGVNWWTRKETRPSATLSITNPIWTHWEKNPGLQGQRPVTSGLTHGTASDLTIGEFAEVEVA
jgi:hypothetical protein